MPQLRPAYLWPIHVYVWQKPSQYCNYPPIKKKKKRPGTAKYIFLMGHPIPHWVVMRIQQDNKSKHLVQRLAPWNQ